MYVTYAKFEIYQQLLIDISFRDVTRVGVIAQMIRNIYMDF